MILSMEVIGIGILATIIFQALIKTKSEPEKAQVQSEEKKDQSFKEKFIESYIKLIDKISKE